MDPSTRTLMWAPIGIDQLVTGLIDAVRRQLLSVPASHKRLHAKMRRWVHQLGAVRDGVQRVYSELVPSLERVLGLHLHDKELLVVAMFQPSTKNLFLELEAHHDGPWAELFGRRLSDMVWLSEAARALALVGDAAISMAVVHLLWSPRPAEVGHLTVQRARIVSNHNLARLCDRWRLFEYRIHFDPPAPCRSEVEHIKGTLVEAVFGIVYLELGLPAVMPAVSHLVECAEASSDP